MSQVNSNYALFAKGGKYLHINTIKLNIAIIENIKQSMVILVEKQRKQIEALSFGTSTHSTQNQSVLFEHC